MYPSALSSCSKALTYWRKSFSWNIVSTVVSTNFPVAGNLRLTSQKECIELGVDFTVR